MLGEIQATRHIHTHSCPNISYRIVLTGFFTLFTRSPCMNSRSHLPEYVVSYPISKRGTDPDRVPAVNRPNTRNMSEAVTMKTRSMVCRECLWMYQLTTE